MRPAPRTEPPTRKTRRPTSNRAPRDRRCRLRARCSPIAGTATSTARWDRYPQQVMPYRCCRSTRHGCSSAVKRGACYTFAATVAAFDDQDWTAAIAPDRYSDHGRQHRDAAQRQRRHPDRTTAAGEAAAGARCAAMTEIQEASATCRLRAAPTDTNANERYERSSGFAGFRGTLQLWYSNLQ